MGGSKSGKRKAESGRRKAENADFRLPISDFRLPASSPFRLPLSALIAGVASPTGCKIVKSVRPFPRRGGKFPKSSREIAEHRTIYVAHTEDANSAGCRIVMPFHGRCTVVFPPLFSSALEGDARMLVLSRQRDESIIIGDDIVITVVDIRGDKVRLGIDAPTVISVHRQEVYEAIQREARSRQPASP
jgi:carbon storage regulator